MFSKIDRKTKTSKSGIFRYSVISKYRWFVWLLLSKSHSQFQIIIIEYGNTRKRWKKFFGWIRSKSNFLFSKNPRQKNRIFSIQISFIVFNFRLVHFSISFYCVRIIYDTSFHFSFQFQFRNRIKNSFPPAEEHLYVKYFFDHICMPVKVNL